MGPIGSPKTSVSNHLTQRNNAEYGRPVQLRQKPKISAFRSLYNVHRTQQYTALRCPSLWKDSTNILIYWNLDNPTMTVTLHAPAGGHPEDVDGVLLRNVRYFRKLHVLFYSDYLKPHGQLQLLLRGKTLPGLCVAIPTYAATCRLQLCFGARCE
jgi:hypothetical protein